MTWRTLCTISHPLMVHAQFSEAYIHFTLMYTTDHIFPVLPSKNLINKYGELTTWFKLATGTKPSILYLRIFFSMCCTKIYCTCWYKGGKHAPSSAKVFSRYIHWDSAASKRVYFTYPTNARSYLRMLLFLMRVFLVHWHTHHRHIQKQWVFKLQWYT